MLPRSFEVLIQAGNSARFLGDSAGRGRVLRGGGARASRLVDPALQHGLPARRDGDPQAALASLGDATALGFASPQLLERNEDFDPVRPLPGWADLVARVRAKAAERGAQSPQLPARAG